MTVRSAGALLAGLDDRQRRAAQHCHGPIAVIAGAGTGKTRVLVARVAWLIAAGYARPDEICALTFMNDSAREIEQRLQHALGADVAARITVGTSHRIANALLRTCAGRFERRGRYSIWDGDQTRRALARALGDAQAETVPAARVHTLASTGAARLRSPWQAAVAVADDERDAAWAGLLAYERAKRASAAFDFDDLLLYAAVALESDYALRAALGRRWQHVLLDEAQDTNPVQYRIVALLAADHRNLMIVGDPDQAICSYRGATSNENFAAFVRDFPEHEVVTLERNYRSTRAILRAANAVIAGNRGRVDKRLWTDGPAGEPVVVVDCDDELEEAERIAAWARREIERGCSPSGLCALARVNELAAGIERALIAARVPVHVAGAVGFNARTEIRDALAALSLVANPRDRLAFARVARAAGAGVGEIACRALFDQQDVRPQRSLLEHGALASLDRLRAKQAHAVRELCRGLLAVSEDVDRRPGEVGRHVVAALLASRQPERLRRTLRTSASDRARHRSRRALERLRELVRLARAYEASASRPDLGDFVAGLTLATDSSRPDADAVSVMTVHRAKGLEFDHVWVAGLEERLFPHRRSVREGSEPEERRLAYVAVTRARLSLHVSWARERAGRPREPSRYVADLAGHTRPTALS
jgi:superfamily I DNA/RNA helicase